MVTFNYKEKEFTFGNRIIFKTSYADDNVVSWFCGWLVRYENELDFLRVRLNGRLVARAATYTGV